MNRIGQSCAPIDIYPAGYELEYNGDLVDEAISTFGLYLDDAISYRDSSPIECVFFNENYKKLDGNIFRALFLTANAFSEISQNDEAMEGVTNSAFAHYKNEHEESHMILFLNSSDQDQGMGALTEAVQACDDSEYDLVDFSQTERTSMTDDFHTFADSTPDIYGDAHLSGDFDFIITQCLCYDVPEEVILSKKENKPPKESKPKSIVKDIPVKSLSIQGIASEIFEKMGAFPSQYGFHFSYSPESAWNGDAEYLILTINPSASDGKGRAKKIVPKSPFPLSNDFFDPKNKFAIQKPVQAICYELSQFADNPVCTGATPLEAANNFADHCAILASFVPFRTKEAGDITNEMKEFAATQYWGKLFPIWQPKVIVTIGNPPFAAMQDFLKEGYAEVDSLEAKVSDTSKLTYRMARYQKPSGGDIILIGLPHPTAFGEKGFPANFPETAHDDSPLRNFLTKVLKGAEKNGASSGKKGKGSPTSDIIRMAQEARKARRKEAGLED